jgi:hypothetical protein
MGANIPPQGAAAAQLKPHEEGNPSIGLVQSDDVNLRLQACCLKASDDEKTL